MFYKALQIFSGASHFIYGILALLDPFYIDEFVRYGFSDFRVLIAVSQSIAGALLLLGVFRPKFTAYSSAFLATLMAF